MNNMPQEKTTKEKEDVIIEHISTLLQEKKKEVLEEYSKFLDDNCKEGETIEITIDKYLKSLINKQ